jgi:hypothetical protein
MDVTRLRAAAWSSCALLAGCASAWPWTHRPADPPAVVQELVIEPAAGGGPISAPQYWERNTLLIDLSSIPASGALALRPNQGSGWPIRLAFRVRPGSTDSLEVRGEQRVVYAVPGSGKPLLLALDPGVYSPRTASISLQWRGAAGSEH